MEVNEQTFRKVATPLVRKALKEMHKGLERLISKDVLAEWIVNDMWKYYKTADSPNVRNIACDASYLILSILVKCKAKINAGERAMRIASYFNEIQF